MSRFSVWMEQADTIISIRKGRTNTPWQGPGRQAINRELAGRRQGTAWQYRRVIRASQTG